MGYKKIIQTLGFQPKENTSNVFVKKYVDDYAIEIDFDNEKIDFGNQIKSESKTTQNFSQLENWVVLECVNRLLEKGYNPQDITLEKTFKVGHGASGGRLDIFVEKEGKAFLMIECKTYGKEYEKELKNLEKDGGQLFTYFQNDRSASLLVLYTSKLINDEIVYENTIVNIEQEYRETTNVKDFYERWNKLPKKNGVFETWVRPYGFESKALTIDDLVEIKPEDSSFIFNRFLEILRHNVVSDKGNAFNRIFTLFLCKIYDEKINEGTQNELGFQWFEAPFKYEGIEYEKDDHRTFQLRLTELYSKGMHEFLEKVVTDFSETEFKNKFPNLSDEQRNPIINEFRRIRLEKNNEFAIKDVYDAQSFEENAVVVKEIVELLQNFKLRYTKKQQYLSDFFELLLTTGLKQESGQFFTPVPIAQYVIKSLPIDKFVEKKLSQSTVSKDDLLPYVMDYAAGSGHFLTETMHIIQSELNKKEDKQYHKNVGKYIRRWQDDHFNWAIDYVYGIEKDYRLVKVGKVGCYLHGDGLANVIHTDGLAKFGHPDYKGKLLETDDVYPKENKQFDVIVSNPPYSVSAFKNVARKYYTEDDFEIYNKLTDQSSEIECLFIERTKQLLKDGGVAGVILPSSILSNTGIYTKAREIILKYFDVLGITELGSNTFMATGTNTVVLFLRRRSNYLIDNLTQSVKNAVKDKRDITLNGIENAISKYVSYVWEDITLDDYKTLLQKEPNKEILNHEIYKEYKSKLKTKNDTLFWEEVINTETEKLLYFTLTFNQKVVVVKTGQKNAEKNFLGYYFSNRRGSEGIHAMESGKEIHECTSLFDEYSFTNKDKASTYNYLAFAENNFDAEIPENLKENISYQNLVDMLTFDRADFEKNISLSAKKKVRIESKWELKSLSDVSVIDYGTRIVKKTSEGDKYPVYGGGGETFRTNTFNRQSQYVISRFGMSPECVRFIKNEFFLNDSGMTLNTLNEESTKQKYLDFYLFLNQEYVYNCGRGVAQKNIDIEQFNKIKIPLPPLKIQEKIVSEIEVLEKQEEKAVEEVERLKLQIIDKANQIFEEFQTVSLGNVCEEPVYGANEKAIAKKSDNDYRYIRITDINDDGTLNNDFKTAENVRDKYILKENDFLFARSGATAGKTFLYKNKYGKALYAGYLIRFRVNESISADFLNFILKSDNYVSWVLKNRLGSAQPNINAKQFSSFEIPLPPLSEQQKIVTEITEIENQISELEQQIVAIPIQKEDILKKYL